MGMRVMLAVAMLVLVAVRGPVLAQTDGEDEHDLEEPGLDEPGLGEDEPGTAPEEAPQDHGYHHRYDFDGGGDDELPTEPASGPRRHELPADGIPAETAPAAPESPPADEPANEAPAAAPAEL